jgi:7-cyano-7-deazaguanine synthase
MKVLILFSGGLDSLGLLIYALQSGYEVCALHLSYDHPAKIQEQQTSKKAIISLQNIYRNKIEYFSVPHSIVANEMYGTGARYVPMRNLSFLAVAANWAISHKCIEIWIGANNNDQDDYVDCRPEFFGLFKILLQQQLYNIEIRAPYLEDNKKIMNRSLIQWYCERENIEWISCYEPKQNNEECGICNSCLQNKIDV